jgi:hypothetical protein
VFGIAAFIAGLSILPDPVEAAPLSMGLSVAGISDGCIQDAVVVIRHRRRFCETGLIGPRPANGFSRNSSLRFPIVRVKSHD